MTRAERSITAEHAEMRRIERLIKGLDSVFQATVESDNFSRNVRNDRNTRDPSALMGAWLKANVSLSTSDWVPAEKKSPNKAAQGLYGQVTARRLLRR